MFINAGGGNTKPTISDLTNVTIDASTASSATNMNCV